MDVKDKKIKRDLIEATKAVKRKFQELHSDKLMLNEQLEEKFMPITKSLRTIIENQKVDQVEEKQMKDLEADSYGSYNDNNQYDDDDDGDFADASSNIEETPKSIKMVGPKKINFGENLKEGKDDLVTDDDDILEEGVIDWPKYNAVLLTNGSDTQYGVRRSRDHLDFAYVLRLFH